ncbi:MAG: response regulator [Chloracidobacterium sp.]|uniref:Response regulator n=1 Tax=Chloracidobacterium validum TaxID=2821543 RepID=A0ABX8BA57_9BACT|nr:response regulator [Chloracidobacterium validum]QUW03559.1 response regulator [Chloracidobacterium validum]
MPTVLIVDDESFFLDSVVEGLSAALPGVTFLKAHHGEEALHQLERSPVDALVTDLKMPVVDGFQLLAQLTQRPAPPAVIVMTAFGTADIERRVRRHGIADYIEKPIDLQALANSLRQALAQRAGGYLQGISLSSFLQLLGLERKSCRLVIRQAAQVGELWFEQGQVVHAVVGDLQGEAAAHVIVAWESPEIALHPAARPSQRTVHADLDQLLLDAHRLFDEQQREGTVPQATLTEPFSMDEASPRQSTTTSQETYNMANIKESLTAVMDIEGCIGAALADWKSGMCLGTIGGTPTYNLEIAAAGNTEVVRAKMKAVANLNLKETVEDILITLDTQYHLIRMVKSAPNLFFYVAIKKDTGNLALARHKLNQIESSLVV